MNKAGFGTAPVFFTAISTILGAILFLRFGYAVGEIGFLGTILVVLVGHIVTIPTALAIAELATNQKVEGGGEYFIISRSFGLNIGATIGIALYFSQAISVAFYVIAFTEAFAPLFDWVQQQYGWDLPRQVISLPAMALLSWLMLTKGADMGVKALYFVVAILGISLIAFFVGGTDYSAGPRPSLLHDAFDKLDNFFPVFAIIFPAFTGMTAGVGLSGDLKDPSKSIPLGTLAATVAGMIIYFFIAYKLGVSASAADLTNDQLIMGKIALGGMILIPLGLAASTISSALGSIMVAPRTLQALGADRAFPVPRFNALVRKGIGEKSEPYFATLVTCGIAFFFVALGDVNAVAEIISMFFMVTYGSICLISFLQHFGADPSYRPSFRSRWPISLIGFVACVLLMFMINTAYAIGAGVLMAMIYIGISYYHKDRGGLENIFQGAIFQLSRSLQVFLQKTDRDETKETWRPSVVCVSKHSYDRDNAFDLLSWISYKYGFATYIHYIEGFYSTQTHKEAKHVKEDLVLRAEEKKDKVYIDTLISPSYTSAIAQVIQLPGISGKDNNMIVFEFLREDTSGLQQIMENYPLAKAGAYDVCIMSSTERAVKFYNGVHIWIKPGEDMNTNLMILMSYIIIGHPSWKGAQIRIFNLYRNEDTERVERLKRLVKTGRLPISENNIQHIEMTPEVSHQSIINEKSREAGLTLIGFRPEQVKNEHSSPFTGYDDIKGSILFVNAFREHEIK